MILTHLITPACLILALAPGCKQQEDRAPAAPATGSSSASATEAASSTRTEPDSADRITVLARHKEPKPSDPVRLDFQSFKVVTADFDPKRIEGGKATIEIDLSSLRTSSQQRDDHLKSPAYLDVARIATATITIDNVKQKAGATYAADATVVARGITKTYPVTFDVLDRHDDRIKIRGEHTFTRLDFGIGTDPANNPDEQVGTDVTIEMVLTMAKT